MECAGVVCIVIMSLLDNTSEYEIMTNAIVATFNADTGTDGLREAVPVEGEPVKLIEAELRGEDEPYKRGEIPAIAIVPTGKTQDPAPVQQQKTFALTAWVYIRGHDKKTCKLHLQRIASRVETLIEEQWNHDNLFQFVERSLKGSAEPGSLTTAIIDTKLGFGKFNEDAKGGITLGKWLALGIIDFTVSYVADLDTIN